MVDGRPKSTQWKGIRNITNWEKQVAEQYTFYKMIPVMQKHTHIPTYTKSAWKYT